MPENTTPALLVSLNNAIAQATIKNPPVNVLDARLMTELRHFLLEMRDNDTIKVIVFESDNAEFFIPHVDMGLIDDPHAFDEIVAAIPSGLNVFQALGELVRGMPQVTIAKVAGIARGGGAEFVEACDMVFGSIETARFGQIEALMGIVPSGGAMQYLSARMSRGRLMEVLLGAELFSATEAASYGWINRALPSDELDDFVANLARNIASLPEGVVPAVKRVLPPTDFSSGFQLEEEEWGKLFARPAAERLIRGGLAAGAQTVEGEKKLEQLLRELGE